MALDFGHTYLSKDSSGMVLSSLEMVRRIEVRHEYNEGILPNKVAEALPFILELANAQSSREVAVVLETASAPVGSYRQKYSGSMICLNAFFGYGGGFEHYLDAEDESHQWMYGTIMTPVGVHFSWPVERRQNLVPVWDTHYGVFLSIIDFGPILTGGDDSDDVDPNVGFEQILSPGIYFISGINRRYPVVLGAGVSYTPHLRDFENEEDADEVSVVRLTAFISMDLALYPLKR